MQADLRQLHASVGIAAESWSPLAPGEVLDESAITALDRGERTGPDPDTFNR